MPQTNPVYDALIARRSGHARALALPAPSVEELAAIITAAARAPDHGRLVPFRFIAIADATRLRLADLLEAASLEAKPDLAAGEITRAREKADQGPLLLMLVGRIDPAHPKITASDQWLAVGCALENLLLATQSFGYAAAIRSGRFLEAEAMRAGFSLQENEHLVSLIAIGTATDWPTARPKPALEAVFSHWAG